MNPSIAPSRLVVDKVSMRWGGIRALQDVSITLPLAGVSAIIGPNGAGKTTLFNCITGFYKPTSGRIELQGPERTCRLDAMATQHIVTRARIARTFQNIRLFGGMTCLENLLSAQHGKLNSAGGLIIGGLFQTAAYRRGFAQALDVARYWIDRAGLTSFVNAPAASLPYGLQRRLEIARAMCTRPALLCLDEPAAGLNPRESADLTARCARWSSGKRSPSC